MVVTAASTIQERMKEALRLRSQGLTSREVAARFEMDPIIVALWFRLPDDLWPTDAAPGVTPRTEGALPFALPTNGLRRVVTCRVPLPALDRLRSSGKPLLQAAAVALSDGLSSLPRPEVASDKWCSTRPLAVPIGAEDFGHVLNLAREHFGGDLRYAAGWAIAQGLGLSIPLPTKEALAARRLPLAVAAKVPEPYIPPPVVCPRPRRNLAVKAPLPADDSVPSGEQLRQRREALGLSQRDLARASGLWRGLICEIERGRRQHVLSRQRLAGALTQLEQEAAARNA